MRCLPAHLRARIQALGELSRPLGEAGAAALARSLAGAVIADISQGRDPEATLDAWIRQIACEITAKTQDEGGTSNPRRPTRSLKDLLPEIR